MVTYSQDTTSLAQKRTNGADGFHDAVVAVVRGRGRGSGGVGAAETGGGGGEAARKKAAATTATKAASRIIFFFFFFFAKKLEAIVNGQLKMDKRTNKK